MQNSYKSIIRRQAIHLKWGKNFQELFQQRRYTNDLYARENIVNIQKVHSKATVRSCGMPRMAKMKTTAKAR